MDEQLISHVEDLGLSNKEAKVYVAALMLGPSPVQKIADFASVKRVTAYVILEALANLGLVSQTVQGKKTFFVAEEPESLRRLLDKKQQSLKEQATGFESLLPELKKLKGLPQETPGVQFYDSPEGIRALFSSFFAAHKLDTDLVYGISNLDQLREFFPELADAPANPERTKHGLRSRYIYTSERGPIYRDSDKSQNRESRWLPPDKYNINGEINIIGNHVIMLSFSGTRPIGVSINSADIAKGMTAIFELAWEAAAPYN